MAGASPAERAASGKAARKRVPRSSHADWQPPGEGRSATEILAAGDVGRIPELLPLRHERMAASAFSFFRGGAAVMAADLAETPTSGLRVQLCGDAHLSNFGGFAAPDRASVFDLNDFDETIPGPWEWDLKRLVASVEVAGRDRGFGEDDRLAALLGCVANYRRTMRELATLGDLEVWYRRSNLTAIRAEFVARGGRRAERTFDRVVGKAEAKDARRALARLTEGGEEGAPRIVADPPLIVPIEDLAGADGLLIRETLEGILDSYRETLPGHLRTLLDRYSYAHAARKVVGVGSVGSHAWVVLMTGRDATDPLFLQVKEAGESVLEPYVGASAYDHHGQRVVEGQRLIQAAGDIMLGWIEATGIDGERRHFYVRQLWDKKGSVPIERIRPEGLTAYAELCGGVLARAHARSGDRIAIAAYVGSSDTLDRALAGFASVYADQNERDHTEFAAAGPPRAEAEVAAS